MKTKQFIETKWKNMAIIALLLSVLIIPAIPVMGDVMHIRAGGTVAEATSVHVEELGTATYDDAQDFINFFGDRTLLSGGAITAHGDADGSVAIASCTAWCKETDSDTAVGRFFDYAGKAKQTLTDLNTNLIYLDYNAGTPQIVVATAPATYGFQQDHILIGVVFRQGNAVHIKQSSNIGIQGISRAFMHAVEHFGAHRSSGLVTSDGGALSLSVTTGIIYAGLIRQATIADGSTWSYWYTSDSGATWNEDTAQSVLVQSYNDITSGKVALGSNKYGVHWVYVDYEGSHLHIVYGQGNYNVNQAEEAGVPSVLPPIVTGFSVLIAKIINQEGTNDMTITYPWTTVFTSSLATDHGSLGGLGDDDHPQYIKDAEFTQDSGILVGTGAGTFAEETGDTLRTSLGLAIGTNVQAWDTDLYDIAALADTDGNFIVGNGAAWVAESGAIVRASLGLTIGTNVLAWYDNLDDIAALTPTDSNIMVGDGTDWVTESGATARTSLGLAIGTDVLAEQTIGIADNNLLEVDGSPADNDYAKFTTDGLEGRSYAEVKSDLSIQSNIITITFIIDGGGAEITTGEKGHLEIPFACTITGWTLLADQSGSIVIDVWKDTYANFPPTVADTIAGSEKPTLSSAQKNQDLALGTWTTAVSAGDILAFNVDSASTVERITLSIRATKT